MLVRGTLSLLNDRSRERTYMRYIASWRLDLSLAQFPPLPKSEGTIYAMNTLLSFATGRFATSGLNLGIVLIQSIHPQSNVGEIFYFTSSCIRTLRTRLTLFSDFKECGLAQSYRKGSPLSVASTTPQAPILRQSRIQNVLCQVAPQ